MRSINGYYRVRCRHTLVPFFPVRFRCTPRERILRISASSRLAASWHRVHKAIQGVAVIRLNPSVALQHRQTPKTSAFRKASVARSLRSKPQHEAKLAFGRLRSAVRQISSRTSALFSTPASCRRCIFGAAPSCRTIRLGPLAAELLGHGRRQRSLRFSAIRFIILAGR